MPLPSPNLDDRNFAQLVADAVKRLRDTCPDWTDLSPGDPGMVLLELFAYLTETMIYRLNRLPDKAYVEFLNLIGLRLEPPRAAAVRLRFSAASPPTRGLEIPRGTRVTVDRDQAGRQPTVFVTTKDISIAAGDPAAEVMAYHCEWVEGELAGVGTGLASQWVRAKRAPIVAAGGEDLELLVGIEASADELKGARTRSVDFLGKVFRIWSEVPDFSHLDESQECVYVCERSTGTIAFAPQVMLLGPDGLQSRQLAQVPARDREIRLWYPTGGGPAGNVAANSLTVLKDAIAKVTVNNPLPAVGGRATETLENALRRGPQEFHELHRAVTAHDFEQVAVRRGGVARAKAFTSVRLWAHAEPGNVEVLLVPQLPEAVPFTALAPDLLQGNQTPEALSLIQSELDSRRPLGTFCSVNWVRYKTVSVKARVVVYRGEDPRAVRSRVLDRLYQTICPVASPMQASGWRFGQSLRVSHIFDIALAEPGVSYADRVRLIVHDVPGKNTKSIDADHFQPRTWYAGAGSRLFRTFNDGDGWEMAADFGGWEVTLVKAHPQRPGIVAVVSRNPDDGSCSINLSRDAGENWQSWAQTAFGIHDVAWMTRETEPALLLAAEVGLYELSVKEEAVPLQILVDPKQQKLGFYAVAAATDLRGNTTVAAAAQGEGGVFLSTEGGRAETFQLSGMQGKDVRVLEAQYDGPAIFLWAGCAASGNQPGEGCHRLQLRGSELAPEGWRPYIKAWDGGSCRSITFFGGRLMAATHRAGVLWLETGERDPAWHPVDVNGGLPLRDVGRLHPVDCVASDPHQRAVLAGGIEGVFRSRDQGVSYRSCSDQEFTETVTLPDTWLFCSGAHDIEVIDEDETRGD